MKETIRTLKINLNNQKVTLEEKPTSQATLEEKLGGFGKAIHDMQKHLELNPGLYDAFDPRNLISVDIGCLTGSRVATSRRTYVTSLSPLKTSKNGANGLYYSAASGDLGPAIRGNYLDSIQMIGRCDTPTYIVIENGDVSFRDASHLVGLSTSEKIRTLAKDHEGAAFAAIGPAGENKVRFANIAFSTYDQLKNGTDHMRYAGRGGMGAVLGDKNILAIVVKGEKYKPDVGDVKEVNALIRGEKTAKYRDQGTLFANLPGMEKKRIGIHSNFSVPADPATQALYRESLEKDYDIKNKGCLGCTVQCWKEIIRKADGKILGKADYEPVALLGPNLGITKIEQIMELVNLSDGLGLDSMSAGVCLGYEMAKQDRFGDFEFARDLLRRIGAAEHGLKDGVMRYSGNAPDAMHVKGVELAAYLGHQNPGYAFAIAGPHTSIDTYNRAIYPGAANSVEEWVENIAVRGHYMILYDMNGLCKFAKVDFDHVAALHNYLLGDNITAQDLKAVTTKVRDMARGIEARLGFTHQDDVLPAKCHEDIGSSVPHFNTLEFFAELKKGVYERMGEKHE